VEWFFTLDPAVLDCTSSRTSSASVIGLLPLPVDEEEAAPFEEEAFRLLEDDLPDCEGVESSEVSESKRRLNDGTRTLPRISV